MFYYYIFSKLKNSMSTTNCVYFFHLRNGFRGAIEIYITCPRGTDTHSLGPDPFN